MIGESAVVIPRRAGGVGEVRPPASPVEGCRLMGDAREHWTSLDAFLNVLEVGIPAYPPRRDRDRGRGEARKDRIGFIQRRAPGFVPCALGEPEPQGPSNQTLGRDGRPPARPFWASRLPNPDPRPNNPIGFGIHGAAFTCMHGVLATYRGMHGLHVLEPEIPMALPPSPHHRTIPTRQLRYLAADVTPYRLCIEVNGQAKAHITGVKAPSSVSRYGGVAKLSSRVLISSVCRARSQAFP